MREHKGRLNVKVVDGERECHHVRARVSASVSSLHMLQLELEVGPERGEAVEVRVVRT